MPRYTVEDCGCIRYQDSNDPLPRTIVWCGTATRDIGALRDALDRAEVIAEREARLGRIAATYPEAAAIRSTGASAALRGMGDSWTAATAGTAGRTLTHR